MPEPLTVENGSLEDSSTAKKEVWILEDDRKYLNALSEAIVKRFNISPQRQEFVEPLYNRLVKQDRYPDIFIIDLLNRPTSLRGNKTLVVKGLRLLRFILGPLYYRWIFKPGAARLMDKLNKKDFESLTPKDILCWPWGGLQLLAKLADEKLLPIDHTDPNSQQPEIVVNSIVNYAAPEWDLPQVVKDINDQLLPRIDALLVEKFGSRRAGKPPAGPDKYKYISYVVKGEGSVTHDTSKDSETEVLLASDIQRMLETLHVML